VTWGSLVWKNLLRRRARTGLTALGVGLGVGLIIALLAITAGVHRTAEDLIHVGRADFGLFQGDVNDFTRSNLPQGLAASVARDPAVAQVAIVAYPDERLGERACAVAVLKPNQALDLAAVTEFLKGQKVATQYIPERLVLREAMPATPSGKIQKFRLREMLREGAL